MRAPNGMNQTIFMLTFRSVPGVPALIRIGDGNKQRHRKSEEKKEKSSGGRLASGNFTTCSKFAFMMPSTTLEEAFGSPS